jgi:amino acid transporter
MKTWFLWAGISFVIGGVVSFVLTKGATESVSFQEDISGYSIGWIIVGLVLILVGFLKRNK